MTILIECVSVIIKRNLPGWWQTFMRGVPNQTLCADDELARIGFMGRASEHEVER